MNYIHSNISPFVDARKYAANENSQLELFLNATHENFLLNIQHLFEVRFEKIDDTVIEKILQKIESNQTLIESPDIYNDLNAGRMNILVSLSILYDVFPNLRLKKIIKGAIVAILKDATFYKQQLSWLQPDYGQNSLLFQGNLGIFLGFHIANQQLQDKNLSLLIDNISLEIDMIKVSRNEKKLLYEIKNTTDKALKIKNLSMLIDTYKQKPSKSLLEFLIVFAYTSGVPSALFNEVLNFYYSETRPTQIVNLLLKPLPQKGKKDSFVAQNQILYTVMSHNFPRLEQYCTTQYFKTFISKFHKKQNLFNTDTFFAFFIKNYTGNGKPLLRDIIKLEKLKLAKYPPSIFIDSTSDINHYLNFRVSCNESQQRIFSTKIKFNLKAFYFHFSNIPWNSMENGAREFKNEFINEKIKQFKQKGIYIISIFKHQRFDKATSVQVQDLIGIQQVQFFNFFAKNFSSLDEYKKAVSSPLKDEVLLNLYQIFTRNGILIKEQ